MEEIIIYLLKSSGLIAAFFLSYHFLLRKETFFSTNRWFLLIGLITSVLLPLFFIKKIIFIERPEIIPFSLTEQASQSTVKIQDLTVIVEPFNWIQFIGICYAIVAGVLVIKILFNFILLFRMFNGLKINKLEQFKLIDSSKNTAPFSFFNYIVYNSELYTTNELQIILSHEKIHSLEKHSVDVILSELFCALFWINPFIWLYKKAILQNLEYIADQKAIEQLDNKKSYQHALLKVVSHQNCLPITNNFYQPRLPGGRSLIKKRIIMLNKNQSHRRNAVKYVLVLPALVAFVFLFQVKTVAQVKTDTNKEITYAVSTSFSSILTKNTTDQEIKELEKTFSDEKQKLTISNVKRNNNDEIIAIKLEFDFGKTYNRIMERKSDKGIQNIKIYINSDEDDDLAYGFEDVDSVAKEATLIEENEPKENFWSMDNMKKNGKEVVLIINGKIKGRTEKVKLPMDEEIGEMKEITGAEFEKKYNQKADVNKYYFEASTVKTVTKGDTYHKAVNRVTLRNNESKDESFEATKLEGKNPISQENQKPKVIVFSNDNGDDIVIMDHYKLFKVPGNPAAQLTNNSPVLIINGNVQSNPKTALETMDVTTIKSVRVYDENDKETKGTPVKKIVITTK